MTGNPCLWCVAHLVAHLPHFGMPRKRSNREGSIYKNESRGRWEAALVVGHHPDGRPIRRRLTARTRVEVTGKLDDAKKALDQGLAIPDPKTTIAEYAKWWLADVLPSEGLAPKTERWYGEMVDLLLPDVGHRTLTGPRALTPADVEALCGKMRTPRTADAVRTTLSKLLRSARDAGTRRPQRRPARQTTPRRRQGPRGQGPHRHRGDRRCSTPSTAPVGTRSRWWVSPPDSGPANCSRSTGPTSTSAPIRTCRYARRSATWAGCRSRPRNAHVATGRCRSSLRPSRRSRRGASPRRQNSWPRAPCGRPTGPGWCSPPRTAGLIGSTPTGTPSPQPLPGAHPHRLRHSYAIHLLEAGTPIHHVAELMGDTVGTIEGTYSHVLRHKHEVVDVARGLLGGAT